MTQAIAGVTPSQTREVEIMTVWPSNAATGLGRALGLGYELDWGWQVLTLGNLLVLASIPLAVPLYFSKLLPFIGTRYTLTNRRVVIRKGITGVDGPSVKLEAFDAVDVLVHRGQKWYDAGDLVFRQGNKEVFRLKGVSRPEAFRQTCLKARNARVGVLEAQRTASR